MGSSSSSRLLMIDEIFRDFIVLKYYIFNFCSCKMIRLNLAVLLLVASMLIPSNQANYYPLKAPYWGAYQFKVSPSGGGSMAASASFIYYNVPFTSAVSNILEISAVLSTYQLSSSPNMLFRISPPTYNAATQTATFGVQVLSNSVFAYIRFFIVYNTQLSSSFFEINVMNKTCSIANGVIGVNKTEPLTTSTRLQVNAGDTFTVQPVLSGITLYNNNQAMQFNFNLPASPMTAANTLSFDLVTTSMITEIMVTTFIIKNNIQPFEYVFYQQGNYILLRTDTIASKCSSNFNIPAINGPIYNTKCSIAVSFLQDDFLSINRAVDFDVTTVGFISCTNNAQTAGSGTMTIGFSILCSYKAVCNSTLQYYDPAADSCQPCANLTLDCETCNKTRCITCITGKYPSFNGTANDCFTCNQTTCTVCLSATTCGACNNATFLNANQTCSSCTLIANCVYCSSSTFCLSCNPPFGPDPTGACSLCNNMISQCKKCNNYYTCVQCNPSYFVSPAGNGCTSCSFNISNCNSCGSSSNCTGCSTGYFLVNNTCSSCFNSIPYCKDCTSTTNCSRCIVGFYLVNPNFCNKCNIIGCYDCTGPTTCVTCSLGYYMNGFLCTPCPDQNCVNCTSATTCVQCATDYDFNTTSQRCACKSGYWSVTKVCTNVVACVTAVKINNTSTCIFCNNLNHFMNVNNSCVCQKGYKQNGTQGTNCIVVCGDGIIISGEVCDDGNTNDGDGCSSSCTKEPSYDCGYYGTKYICKYTGDFKVNLEYIMKSETKNSATYFFSISPATYNLQLVNYITSSRLYVLQPIYIPSISNITLPNITIPNITSLANLSSLSGITSLPSLPSITYTPYLPNINNLTSINDLNNYTTEYSTQTSYSSGMLTVNVDFSKDIEGLPSVFYLQFDTTYFNSADIKYPFESVGTNQPLLISPYVSHIKYIKIIAYAIVGIAALIILLSVGYEKMIGIETVNVIEIIVFSKLLFVQNDILVSGGIVNMKYINGYNDVGKNFSHTHQIPLPYRRLEFNSDYILNFQTGMLLMGLSLVIQIILEIYRKWQMNILMKTKKGSIDEFKLAQQGLALKNRFVYERAFLVVACITLFDCLAAVRLQSRSIQGESHYTYFIINLLCMLFSLIYIFSILTYEVLSVGKQHTWIAYFCSYSEHYVGYYLCYILFMTPLLIGGETLSGLLGALLVGVIVFVNLAILIIWRPYKQAFHNFAIIYNNSVVVFIFIISIIMINTTVSQYIQLIWAYLVMGLLFLMEVFAFIRIYFASIKAPKDNQSMNRTEDEQLKKGMDKIEMELLNSHARHNNALSKTKQEEDDLIKLRNRLKKQFKAKKMEQGQQI